MRYSLGVLALIGLGISPSGCAEASYCPVANEQVVELFTWWTQTGEAAARDELVRLHETRMAEQQEPTRVIATTMDNNRLARDFLERRNDKRHLPDTFQLNIGQELLTWKEQLEPLNFLLEEQPNLREAFFDATLIEASSEGVLYGVPLNIHRMNTLYYNREIVDGLIREGGALDTLEGLEAMCAELKAKYPERSPIVLGTKGATWTLGLLVHQALFPAMAGVDRYRKLWRGAPTQQDYAYFGPIWDSYDRILEWKKSGWINSDFHETKWTDAINRLLLPADDPCQATFFVMGDWVQAELTAKDIARLGRVPFPTANGKAEGNAPAFVWTADTFPLPKNSQNKRNTIELLRTMTQKSVQLAFSKKKSAIAARAMEISWYEADDQYQLYREFSDARERKQAVLSVSGCLREKELPALDDMLEQTLIEEDSTAIRALWFNDYKELKPGERRCFQSDE